MRNFPRPLLAGLVALTGIRLLIAANLPLGDDEAYYWEWSRHLAAGYVDHPPAIAYLVWAAVRIFGRTPLAIHAVAVLLSFATSLVLWVLAQEILGRDLGATWSVILMNIIPVFAAGSVLVAPDGPLGLCWLLTLLWAWRAARGAGGRAWLAAGVWLGLALDSKYVAAILPLSIALFLALSPAQRRWLRRPEPYLGLAVALALFAPVVWWNATHRWISFAYTVQRAPNWGPGGNFPLFIAFQFVYLAPMMFPALVWALAVATRRGLATKEPGALFLAATGWPVIVGMSALSLTAQVKGHWTAPGFVSAIIALAGIATERPWTARSRAWRLTAAGVLSTTALFAVFVHILPFIATYLLPPRFDPTADYYGWPQAAPQIIATARGGAHGPFFIAAGGYQTIAQFNFSSDGQVTATTLRQGDQYREWLPLSNLRGWDALFIKDKRYGYDVDLTEGCGNIEAARGIRLVRRGIVVRNLDLVWCRNFSGKPLQVIRPSP